MKLATAILLASAVVASAAHAKPYRQDRLTPDTGFPLGWTDGTDDPPPRHRHFRRHRIKRVVRLGRPRSRPDRHLAHPQVAGASPRQPQKSPLVSPTRLPAQIPLPTARRGPDAIQAVLDAGQNAVKEAVQAIDLVADRAYLIATSHPGYTMERQGVPLAIGRLNPVFAHRLAQAIRDARSQGIEACIFSAYRPPGYGVGGFHNKFQSAHAYGLAVDMCGIGRPGSRAAIAWRRIAAAHGVYGPYSVYSHSEWNHMEPCMSRGVTRLAPGLIHTITASGPKILAAMWNTGEAVIAPVGLAANVGAERVHYAGRERRRSRYAVERHRHYWRRHRYAAR